MGYSQCKELLQFYKHNKLHFDMVMIYDFRFLLDQHSELVIYSGSSLKWKSAGRHVAPLGHIILIEKTRCDTQGKQSQFDISCGNIC
jgi:hypothetical protein